MLAELVGWYAGRDQNRRRFPRVKKDYSVEISLDGRTWLPGVGVDISGGGMCVVIERELGVAPFDLRTTVNGREIAVRVAPIWHHETSGGKRAFAYGLQFVSIAVDDWDAVMRWITGAPEGVAASAEDDRASIRMEDKEIVRLLPGPLRLRLLAELVARERLTTSDFTSLAGIHFDYGGIVYVEGRPLHKLTIHSKVASGPRIMRYATTFNFDDGAQEIVVVD